MAEETAAAVAPATPKKGKKSSGAKPKAKTAPSHPKVSVMVPAAIGALKERGGSSLQAIKKYIAANYKLDIDRSAPFIKKYLKSAVESGALLQTKGKGASGSFKLKGSAPKASADARPAKAKKPSAAKKSTPKKAKKAPAAEKKPKAKKAASPKKAAAKGPKATKKAPAKSPAKKVAKPKAPKKAKSPAKKGRSPAKKASKK